MSRRPFYPQSSCFFRKIQVKFVYEIFIVFRVLHIARTLFTERRINHISRLSHASKSISCYHCGQNFLRIYWKTYHHPIDTLSINYAPEKWSSATNLTHIFHSLYPCYHGWEFQDSVEITAADTYPPTYANFHKTTSFFTALASEALNGSSTLTLDSGHALFRNVCN